MIVDANNVDTVKVLLINTVLPTILDAVMPEMFAVFAPIVEPDNVENNPVIVCILDVFMEDTASELFRISVLLVNDEIAIEDATIDEPVSVEN